MFVFPLDKVSAPDTELLELGFPLYCGPKNQFQHANNNLHPSERGRTCRDGSHKYLCVCLWPLIEMLTAHICSYIFIHLHKLVWLRARDHSAQS